ncbi:HCNGP-like protein [Purpureocillium lilacinum]|uniref:HCNGP-like protein n=1 Tax=Purpureocillium lilacinum TaxID=33203 RepID=A0A179HN93_PURLI|nr:HCNGP-like protein [Purpureocillium lilacinum]OAQ91896.1 HCNGP-like protein [Purpureocillium lilacinum]
MSGLVAYASSDDEGDEEQSTHVEQSQVPTTEAVPDKAAPEGRTLAASPSPAAPQPTAPVQQIPSASIADSEPPTPAIATVTQNAVPLGPSLPPEEQQEDLAADDEDVTGAPSSPYTATRALIHDLTLPTIPNLDIPPSPPGSPPTRASKTFEQFLKLKKTGTHFNAKLQNSTALKNPSVTDKLMDYAGLDGVKQYETTLPLDLWNPAAFPESAYVDRLKQTREKLVKRMESSKSSGARSTVDFVPASMPSPGTGGGPSVGGLSRGEKRKGDWK